MTKLSNEYRETMDSEVLHSWARDAVDEIRRLEDNVEALEEIIASMQRRMDMEHES